MVNTEYIHSSTVKMHLSKKNLTFLQSLKISTKRNCEKTLLCFKEFLSSRRTFPIKDVHHKSLSLVLFSRFEFTFTYLKTTLNHLVSNFQTEWLQPIQDIFRARHKILKTITNSHDFKTCIMDSKLCVVAAAAQ